MSKVEIFKGKNSQWYFRVKANNNKIVAQSEGYTRKESAEKGIRALDDAMMEYEMEEK